MSQWESLADPVALTEAMWNHAPTMLAEAQTEAEAWPALTAQELTDMLVYLRNLPSTLQSRRCFRSARARMARRCFERRDARAATLRWPTSAASTSGKTLTEIAAAMWNHEPIMAKAGAPRPKFEPGEMRDLLGYLWAQQFFEDAGIAAAGRRVFAAKRCASATKKRPAKAPKLAGAGAFNGATMVSALWRHGPSHARSDEDKRHRRGRASKVRKWRI